MDCECRHGGVEMPVGKRDSLRDSVDRRRKMRRSLRSHGGGWFDGGDLSIRGLVADPAPAPTFKILEALPRNSWIKASMPRFRAAIHGIAVADSP